MEMLDKKQGMLKRLMEELSGLDASEKPGVEVKSVKVEKDPMEQGGECECDCPACQKCEKKQSEAMPEIEKEMPEME